MPRGTMRPRPLVPPCQGVFEMNVDHVLGILVILGAYCLTWCLLLKSTKIVNNIAEQGSKHARETKPELKPEDGVGSDM
jgi:hypothetical protein